MKRKLVSMLLVLVMLISLFPAMLTSANTAVLYHDLTGGWVAGVTDGGTKGTVSDGTYQIAVGEGVGYNSNRALYVKWTSSENNKDWLNIANDGIKSYTATDRYTISFYIKHLNGNTTYPDVMFGYTGGKNRLAYDASKNGVDGYYAVSQPDANGWQYVTASTIADAAVNFTLNIQKPSFEAYIDNFVVTKNGESTNLLLNGDFETWAPTYLTATAPATTKGLEEWTATASGSSITTRTFVTSVGAENAYSGTQSMYVEFVADDYGKNWVNISNTGTQMASLDTNKSYTVSMYVKGNMLSSASMLMGYLYDDKNDVNTRNNQMLSRMSATEPEDAEKAIDGWRKYTAVLNNPTVGFTINIQCEAKVYIDDVSVVEVGGDGTNLVNNPGFEGTPVWEPSYPDVSAPTTTKALEEWTATASGSSITTRTFVTSVGAENAYSGTQSMYVEFVADNYGKNWVNISNTGTQMASLDANKSYTVSMYVKGNKLSSAAMLMGYLYDDKNDVDTRNYQMLSRMSATEPEDAEKAIDGWRKYTAVLNNPTVGFTINIQCEAKVYIDDVSVVEVGGDGTNLLANPGFEGTPVWEPSYPDVSAPTTTKALEEWTATTSGSSITTRTFVTSVGAENAYSGTQSMYVEFVADNYGKNWVNISNTGAQMASLDANKSYTVSMYVKGNKLSSAAMLMGYLYDDKNDVDTRNYQMLSRMSATEPEDAEKAIDGWRKYTAVLNNPTVGFTINIQCEAKVYIDDVSVVEVGGDGTNLVNNPGFEGGPVILPDITETALDTSKWVIRTGSIGTGSYTAGVTAMEAQHGKRSLHVTWSDTGSGYVLIQSQTATALLTEGETYTLEAYIKRVSGNASVIGGWYNWGGQGVGNSTAGEWSALTASGVYTSTNSPRTVQIVLQGTAGVDMYVDNMVLKNASGVVIWSEDFETATTGYEVSAIKLFDEDMNEITALGSELNGKTATGAVAVTNYDDADLTGQLLIALYDGYQLKELIMSEVERISTTANGATIIRVEFEMPEYKDSYTMKAFIWDDIEKMNPLSRTVAQF